MKATIFKICPSARVVDLSHGVRDFDIKQGAHVLETVSYLPIGIHIAVIDPGVGTKRLGIALQTNRGDVLIGPNNGVLLPASTVLGGIKKVAELSNQEYWQQPVSPIFHGRDIFCPVAAYLANGVNFAKLGKRLDQKNLTPAPYDLGKLTGETILGEIIQINKFGNLTINIGTDLLDQTGISAGDTIQIKIGGLKLEMPFGETFGDVNEGEPIAMKDEYGKMEIALNCQNFASKYQVSFGERVEIKKI